MRNKCAIIGDGIAGSTLYRLIECNSNMDVDIFGKEQFINCGMKSCAWGVDRSGFEKICAILQLNATKYYMNCCNHYYCGRFKIKCDIVMIDKKLLLQDLTGDNVKYEQPVLRNYYRIINATGTPSGNIHKTFQIKIEDELPLSIQIGLFPLHCKWSFPLGHGISHIGVLSFGSRLNGLREEMNFKKVLCECYSQIYCGGLVKSLVKGKVWNVGEAAGVVDPITGSGILTAMTSALLLYENWNSSQLYEAEMLRKFGYTRNFLKAFFHNEYRGLKIKIPYGWRNKTFAN